MRWRRSRETASTIHRARRNCEEVERRGGERAGEAHSRRRRKKREGGRGERGDEENENDLGHVARKKLADQSRTIRRFNYPR